MASSIHIKGATAGSIVHNSRENFSHSVVFLDEKNEIQNDSKEAYKIYRSELAIRSKAYTNRTNQKLQSKAITHLSSVINLEQHHTLKDLESISKHIEKTLDTKVFQVSIHRDEGKLVLKEDDNIILTSGEDFFKNPDNDKLYFDKKYTKEIDMNEYDIKKNYHAHIEFMGLDSTGAGIKRNKLNKHYLSNLQTVVAKDLNMQRGINYKEKGIKAPKRLDVLEYKKANTVKREAIVSTKTKTLAKAKDLNIEIKDLKLKLSTRPQHAELEALNKDLKEQIKSKDLTIDDMKEQLKKLQSDLLKQLDATDSQVNQAQRMLSEARLKNDALEKELLKKPKEIIKEVERKKTVEEHTIEQHYKILKRDNNKLLKQLEDKPKEIINTDKIEELEKELKRVNTLKDKYQNVLKEICPECTSPGQLIANIRELKNKNNMYLGVNKNLNEQLKVAKDKLLEYQKRTETPLQAQKATKTINVSNKDEFLASDSYRRDLKDIYTKLNTCMGRLAVDKEYDQDKFKKDLKEIYSEYQIPNDVKFEDIRKDFDNLQITEKDLKDLNNSRFKGRDLGM